MITEFTEMVTTLKKPGEDLLKEWTPARASAVHMLVGLVDEYTELQEAGVNLQEFSSSMKWDNRELELSLLLGNLFEETGDLLFYIKGIEQDMGLPVLKFVSEVPEKPLDQCFADVVTAMKRNLMYNKPFDEEELTKDLEGMASWVLNISENLGATLENILSQNMEKLLKGKNARYKDGYSNEAANARADKNS